MKNIKILIVDDQPVFRKTLRVLFEQLEGIEQIEEAENGLDCLEMFKKNDFHLVLMDIQMPKMNGIKATEQVQKQFPQTKILGISMYSNLREVKALRQAGASGFIDKGNSIQSIIHAIEVVMQGMDYFPQLNNIQKHPS